MGEVSELRERERIRGKGREEPLFRYLSFMPGKHEEEEEAQKSEWREE